MKSGDDGVLDRINILIVEDDYAQSELIGYLLSDKKYKLTKIYDGREALRYLMIHDEVDIVIMDNNLPSLNGVEIIRELRLKNRQHSIIFSSADSDINVVIGAMREGALDFILKTSPTFRSEVVKVVEKIYNLQLKRRHQVELERRIRVSEENYRNLLNEIEDYLLVLDENGLILQVNNLVLSRLGYSFDELNGMHVVMVHPPEYKEEVESIIEHMFAGNIRTSFIPLYSRDNQKIYVESRINRTIWNGKNVLFALSKDITNLRNSEEKFSKAFGSNPSAMSISSLEDGRMIDVNDSFCSILEFRNEDVIGKTSGELGIYKNNEDWEKIRREVETNGNVRNLEIPLVTKNGSQVHGIVSTDIIMIGNEQCLLTVINDITDRKIAQTKLQEKNEELQSVFDAFPDLLFRLDSTGKIIDFKAGNTIDLFTSPSDFINKRFLDILPPEPAEILHNAFQLSFSGKSIQKCDYSLLLAGKLNYFEARFVPLSDGLITLIRNTTDLQLMFDSLMESKSRVRSLLDNLPFMAWMKDVNGKYEAVNEPFTKLCSLPSDQIIGKTSREFTTNEQFLKYDENDREVIQSHQRLSREEEMIVDGKKVIMETFITPVFDSHGQISGTTGISRDITEKKQLENEILIHHAHDVLLKDISSNFLNLSFNQTDNGIKDALEMVGKNIKADHAFILYLDQQKQTLNFAYEWFSDESAKTDTPIFNDTPVSDVNWWIQQIKKNEYIHINDVSQLPGFVKESSSFLELHHVKSLIIAPILIGENNLIGVIGFDTTESTIEWKKDTRKLIVKVSDIISRALEHKKWRQTIESSEKRLQIALRGGNNGLWDWNYQTGELYLTASAFEMLGYPAKSDRIHVDNWRKLYFANDVETADINLQRHILGETEYYETEQRLLTASGNYKWVLIRGKIMEWAEDGQPLRITGVNTDIDHIKKMEADLILAKAESERANIAKSRFLANMSHEIRTPMNGIIGLSKLLRKTKMEDTQTDYLDAIISSADNLLVIINDILDFSKITEGRLQLENIDLRIDKLVFNLVKSLDFTAKDKDIELKYHLDPKLKTVLLGDPVRINQILVNLLGNALKFTSEGFVELGVSLEKYEGNINYVHFYVKDTGIGIDKDKQESIFEIFSQEDESVSRKFGGTGLGLAISKQLVEMMGGTISLESERGKGAMFSFTIPLADGNSDLQTDEIKEQNESADLSHLRILVAEDHKVNQFLIKSIFKNWNVEPDIAENGIAAVEMVKKNRYDIIFMDKQMPEMGGVEATKIIRGDLKLDVPIIALTAAALAGSKEQALESGMNDYITKPFEAGDLLKIIKKFTTKSPDMSVDITEPYNNTMKQPESSPKLYGLQMLSKMLNNDEKSIREMIRLFIDTTIPIVDEILAEFQKSNFKKVGELAHKLKPSIDFMEIETLYQVVRDIEIAGKNNDAENKLKDLVPVFENDIQIVFFQLNEELAKTLS
jgi:PAS domain S-box-containing protein